MKDLSKLVFLIFVGYCARLVRLIYCRLATYCRKMLHIILAISGSKSTYNYKN